MSFLWKLCAAFALAACIAIPLALPSLPASGQTAPASRPTVRIGTYDSRAVALAWMRSAKVGETIAKLSADAKAAQAAGDQKKYDEIHDRMERLQFNAHAMVFSVVPPDDALVVLKPALPELARQARVVAIVDRLDYKDATIEAVDLTDLMVARFDPTPEVLHSIQQLRDVPPTSLYDAAHHAE